MEKVQVCKIINAAAGASGETTLYTESAARVLKNIKIQLRFPSGASDELRIRFLRGNRQISPESGYYAGDDIEYKMNLSEKLLSEDSLLVKYENTNTTESRKCYIFLEGDRE